jgi:hypothetical protein
MNECTTSVYFEGTIVATGYGLDGSRFVAVEARDFSFLLVRTFRPWSPPSLNCSWFLSPLLGAKHLEFEFDFF